MTEQRPTTKQELLAQINRNWAALTNALARLSPATMTTVHDDHGWSVRDHLVHLYYWERSALFFLHGKPRHEGLDVDETVYLTDDEDVINAAIFHKHQSLSLEDALTQLHALQPQLLTALQPLTDDDLQKRYRHYLPEEPGASESGHRDGPPAMNVVYGNSAHHFAEHLAWIEALTGKQEEVNGLSL